MESIRSVEAAAEQIADYNSFIRKNRLRVDRGLNASLWFCILTGPAIALGIYAGIFRDIGYNTCTGISIYCFVLAVLHMICMWKWSASKLTGFMALFILNVLLVIMDYLHVSIYLTWFFVPLLSMLYCDMWTFGIAVVANYLLMSFPTWLVAPYHAGMSSQYAVPSEYFFDRMGGYTIETCIMVAAGMSLLHIMKGHFVELMDKFIQVNENEGRMADQMEILDSMAEIYDKVNLLDFEEMTEMAVRGKNRKKIPMDLEKQTQTVMNREMQKMVAPDQINDFITFTNIRTVRERLKGKKIIYSEFISMVTGWFRAQYITVDSDETGMPVTVIYTIQNIDNEKRREEHLLRISMTDELTRMFNRRCYESDTESITKERMDDDFALFSIDINGLKIANDTLGHAAGDELIKGAADCMMAVMGNRGKVYRVGGDEFMAVIHTDDCNGIKKNLAKSTALWHGVYLDEMSLSVGYAGHGEFPDADINELEKIADEMMYKEKEEYYLSRGIDRSGQSVAFAAISSSYERIILANLTNDTFKCVNADDAKRLMKLETVTNLLQDAVVEGVVHPDDAEEFAALANLDALRAHFAAGNNEFNIMYRRKMEDGYHNAIIEMIRDKDYTDDSQSVCLSVKVL